MARWLLRLLLSAYYSPQVWRLLHTWCVGLDDFRSTSLALGD
jgi:hypothetical protein